MSQLITRIDQTKVLSQLDTYNHTALQNSMYTVSIVMSEVPPSGLSLVIQQNSVTKASSTAPSSAQGVVSLQTVLNCAASDVISVIISSNSNNDKALNVIKGILSIHTGSF